MKECKIFQLKTVTEDGKFVLRFTDEVKQYLGNPDVVNFVLVNGTLQITGERPNFCIPISKIDENSFIPQ